MAAVEERQAESVKIKTAKWLMLEKLPGGAEDAGVKGRREGEICGKEERGAAMH